MEEYISIKELINLIQELINKELDLGINNKGKNHHFSMNTNVDANNIEINMLDCITLDELEYYYILSSNYEMSYKDKMILLFQHKFNLKKYYEGMKEDNCVKRYLKEQFNVKKLVK